MHRHVSELLFAVGTLRRAKALEEVIGEAIARLPASTFRVQDPGHAAYIEVGELY